MSNPSDGHPGHPELSDTANTVNMADVAARAGVSIATVSRALRDLPGVGEATRTRIKAVADELSYVVSPEASRLARRETGRVAVVVPRADVWFYSAMLAGLERELRLAGLDVLLYQVDGVTARRNFFRDLPSRRKVDAVVLVAMPVLAEEERRLDLMGAEVVVAGGRLRDCPHVRVDDHEVARLAVQHLLDLGHRRIAVIRTSDTDGTRWSADVERVRGFRDTLEVAGCPQPEEYVVTRPFGVHAGAEAIDVLLDLPEPPTAVFTYSDELALAALHRLRERGLSAPRDVSVVGVDGHPLAALVGLTTVDQGVAAQAAATASLVVGLLRGRVPQRATVLSSRLVVRATTAAPAGQ